MFQKSCCSAYPNQELEALMRHLICHTYIKNLILLILIMDFQLTIMFIIF